MYHPDNALFRAWSFASLFFALSRMGVRPAGVLGAVKVRSAQLTVGLGQLSSAYVLLMVDEHTIKNASRSFDRVS